MGSSDVPPSTAPPWLIPASVACLGGGVFFWLAAYVLMARRSLATHATAVPLIPLGLNLAWEAVWALYVTDSPLELVGFVAWLLLDLPVLRATLRTAPRSFRGQPLVARNAGLILGLVFALGVAANGLFAWWWLAEPHRGYGIKWGKTWKGLEARDTTELSWWTAGVAQMLFSVGALSMLVQRGHSGGQSYAIWFCRFVGTQLGLPASCGFLWWYWPEAHGFIFQPLSIIIVGTATICDIAYPFVLAHVRATERILPDGSVVSGESREAAEEKRK
ncbi:hypothetical protein ACRE_064550 [Hapsidospora chrysogenum ATCC 11550]|uniref:Uncharacterized protein n=1 Tax=Hapsidospora chrysogenum (strain ATCC 11550 / CBS 779.69 / DSM 880 / IAM 14645 / JCM 23072 / IMI 49137) TaxID=857340 RepID=A0A086T0B8_HAPC1|nr:hypothetical protein ACRE_064550 [Hapsidospora chrysogenum ATCC 11550]